MDKCCGTCKWFKETLIHSRCQFPLPMWIRDRLDGVIASRDGLNTVYTMEGEDCPTWEAKP